MDRIWRSKTTNYQPQKTGIASDSNLLLPNKIGCKIIELEMQITETENLTKQLILELLQWYSRAVQFYEERGSHKYLLYQKKMQSFLHKPAIAEILKGKTGLMLIKKEKNQEEIRKANTQTQLVAKKLLQQSKKSGQKQEDIINQQLKNQQKNLQERIQRKRANSNRSTRGKVSSASFSVPTGKNESKQEQILISEFMEVPNPKSELHKKLSSKVYM